MTTPNAPESVIEKLRKLLRLSESANEHESALALQRAQELAIRHKIELSSINPNDHAAHHEPMGRQLRTFVKKSMAQRYVAWIVQSHFNVDLVYTGSGHKKVFFIGTRSDIEFAQFVWDFR